MRSEKLGLIKEGILVAETEHTNTKELLDWAVDGLTEEGLYKVVRLTGVEFSIGKVMRTELTLK